MRGSTWLLVSVLLAGALLAGCGGESGVTYKSLLARPEGHLYYPGSKVVQKHGEDERWEEAGQHAAMAEVRLSTLRSRRSSLGTETNSSREAGRCESRTQLPKLSVKGLRISLLSYQERLLIRRKPTRPTRSGITSCRRRALLFRLQRILQTAGRSTHRPLLQAASPTIEVPQSYISLRHRVAVD
jgi:hypothetical protein